MIVKNMKACDKISPKKKGMIPIAAEGYPFIAVSIFVTVYLVALGFPTGALFFFVVTIFVVSFFRDPERQIPDDVDAVICPADGKVIAVNRVHDDAFTGEEMLKMSIFMNVFNVHVNRIPLDGTVQDVSYFPGTFFSADLDKASKKNERNAVYLGLANGKQAVVVQVAGLIARRIVCKIAKGETVRRGERFGLIRFGSRVDLYLPPETKPVVHVGDKVLAGTSIMGRLS